MILYEYYFMRKVLKLFGVVVWVLLLQLILFIFVRVLISFY